MATTERARPPVTAGREALQGHRWQEAFDLLSQADAERSLSGSDLEGLAEAAWFTAKPDLSVEVKERAFKAHLDANDRAQAATVAFDLGREYGMRQKFSISSAWINRGERLLQEEPE